MSFFAFGLNYETAPLGVRERFALTTDEVTAVLEHLELSDAAEVVLLSTCNRTEVYLFGDEPDVEVVTRALARAAGTDWPADQSFRYEDEAAVAHVLRVASGLKSMVVGDVQILAQIKEAYRQAVDARRVGTVLHRLMHTAFRSAKRVLSSTGIGSGAASVSSAAVALSRAHFGGSLAERTVLLIGTGSVGRLVLQALRTAKPAAVHVVNRSKVDVEALRADYPLTVGDWSDRHALMRMADLILVATGADTPVITAEQVPDRPARSEDALVMDLGVPRNVDPAIDDRIGYRVLDMDALDAWTEQVEQARRRELPRADEIVQEELSEFVTWMFHQQALQPAIQAVRETFDRIRRQEIERHQHRFSVADREEIDVLTRSILQKLLAVPIVHLKAYDPESIDLVRGVKLLQSFFSRPGCDDPSAVDAEDAANLQRLLDETPDGKTKPASTARA